MLNTKHRLMSLCVALALAGAAPLAGAAADPATGQAIEAAKAAVKQAGAVGGLWRDTEDALKEAEAAATAGENAKAQALAAQVQKEAELGANQAYLEQAKAMVASAKADKKMAKRKANAITGAEAAISSHEGKKAYDLISAN